MRILLSAQQASRPHPVPAYSFWRYYLCKGLEEAGHEVLEVPGVDWAEGLEPLAPEARRRWLSDTWTQTVDYVAGQHRQEAIGLFLSYLFPEQVDPSAIAKLRAQGIPCVNFFCDNIREFVRVPGQFNCFDLHWVPEHEALALYRSAGVPFVHAPMPAWVDPSLRGLPQKESPVVSFIGSHDLLREELLAKAVSLGLPLRLYGTGWRAETTASADGRGSSNMVANQWNFLRRHGPSGFFHKLTYKLHRRVPRDWIASVLQPQPSASEYVGILRESAVTLGINRYPGFRHTFKNPGRYSRLRDIEAPMLGACYLTEEAPGLDQLYQSGVEIETYRTAEELVEKAQALLSDPHRRTALRTRGQQRAVSSHSISATLSKIQEALAAASGSKP